MVPIFSLTSSRVMPIPRSRMVRVLLLLDTSISMSSSASGSRMLRSVSERWWILSSASEALEISSRRKISFCVYSEWTNR